MESEFVTCAEQTVCALLRSFSLVASNCALHLRNMADTNSISLFRFLPDAFRRGRGLILTTVQILSMAFNRCIDHVQNASNITQN